jgi:hypothetical protein
MEESELSTTSPLHKDSNHQKEEMDTLSPSLQRHTKKKKKEKKKENGEESERENDHKESEYNQHEMEGKIKMKNSKEKKKHKEKEKEKEHRGKPKRVVGYKKPAKRKGKRKFGVALLETVVNLNSLSNYLFYLYCFFNLKLCLLTD